MIDRDPDVPEERRIRFRIGVNLGDVIVEEHDIFGDGVNVAARLEALAEPGGICVSRMVRDNVRDKLDFAFEDMGEQSVKNIVRPARVYALRPEAIALLPAPNVPAAPPASQPVIAPRLSIVVLPFANLSSDTEQQYFADAITENLTTDLSRLGAMLVISRNTAFTYQGKRVDTKQIGRELAVRYVLEGSVHRAGNQIRVSAQLIDAQTDAHLWAERFDGDTSDLFALQDEVTSRIANALGVELIAAEAARPTEHPDALDYILRGRAVGLRPYSRESRSEQISLYERALALDPQSVEAQSRLAVALVARVLNGLSDAAATDLARTETLVDQVLAASPRDAYAHLVKGHLLMALKQWEEAIPEYEAALASNRNLVAALHGLAFCKLCTGSIEEVTPLLEKAICLSPRDPNIGHLYGLIGTVDLVQSHIDEAIIWLNKARSATPAVPTFHAQLASAYALNGEAERATAELAEARRLASDDRYSTIARWWAVGWALPKRPKMRALVEDTFVSGLRKAGMPEE